VAFVTNDLSERVASIAALADPIRRDLYLYVTAQPAPVSRDRASDALGIARHTAKFHLDKLAERSDAARAVLAELCGASPSAARRA
jgi:predicted ArsR family transcriptional regulator